MNNISKEIKGLIFSVFVLTGLFFSSVVFGASSFIFGGTISTVTQCTCSEGSQVIITGKGRNAKFSGTYLYSSATMVKGKGNVTSGRNIIGKYSQGGTCKVTAYPKCLDLSITKGTMKLIQTN